MAISSELPYYATSLVTRKYLKGKFATMMFAAAVFHTVVLSGVSMVEGEKNQEPEINVIRLSLGSEEATEFNEEHTLDAIADFAALDTPLHDVLPKKSVEDLKPVAMLQDIVPVKRPEPPKTLSKPKPVEKKAAPKPKTKVTPKAEPKKEKTVQNKAPVKPKKQAAKPKEPPKKIEIAQALEQPKKTIPTGELKRVSDASLVREPQEMQMASAPPPSVPMAAPKRITLGKGVEVALVPAKDSDAAFSQKIPTGLPSKLPEMFDAKPKQPVTKPQGSIFDTQPTMSMEDLFEFESPPVVQKAPVQEVQMASLGDSQSVEEMQSKYERKLSQWLQKHKIYPREARERAQNGKAVVRIRMDRRGNVKFSSVDQSTGHTLLDDAVMAMVKKANPMPKPPLGYPGGMWLEFLVPVVFELQ